MAVAEELIKLLEKEASIARNFLTTPKGVFETIDESIVAVRQSLQAIRSRAFSRVRILRR